MAVELLLIRHGQSEANAGLSLDPDCSLSETGLEQARELVPPTPTAVPEALTHEHPDARNQLS